MWSLLFVEHVGNGLEELFQDAIHLVLHEKGNVDHVIEIANCASQHGEEREGIAQAGQEEVLGSHTYVQRAQTVLSNFQHGSMNKKVQQRKTRLGEIQTVTTPVYAYVAAVYDSSIASVAKGSVRFRDLSIIRGNFRHFQPW